MPTSLHQCELRSIVNVTQPVWRSPDYHRRLCLNNDGASDAIDRLESLLVVLHSVVGVVPVVSVVVDSHCWLFGLNQVAQVFSIARGHSDSHAAYAAVS